MVEAHRYLSAALDAPASPGHSRARVRNKRLKSLLSHYIGRRIGSYTATRTESATRRVATFHIREAWAHLLAALAATTQPRLS